MAARPESQHAADGADRRGWPGSKTRDDRASQPQSSSFALGAASPFSYEHYRPQDELERAASATYVEETRRRDAEDRRRHDPKASASSRTADATASHSQRYEERSRSRHYAHEDRRGRGGRSRSPRPSYSAIKSRPLDERQGSSRRSPSRIRTGRHTPPRSERGRARPGPSTQSTTPSSVYSSASLHIDPSGLYHPSPLSPVPLPLPDMPSRAASPPRVPSGPAPRTLMQNITDPTFDKCLGEGEKVLLAEMRRQIVDVLEREKQQQQRADTLEREVEYLRDQLVEMSWNFQTKDLPRARDLEAKKLFIDSERRTLCRRLEPESTTRDEEYSDTDSEAEKRRKRKERQARQKKINEKSNKGTGHSAPAPSHSTAPSFAAPAPSPPPCWPQATQDSAEQHTPHWF